VHVRLVIDSDAYPYLVAQRGALDDMKGDPDTWCRRYCDVLHSEFDMIEPFLPRFCSAVLDVGSGLGGIDALINEHYGGDLSVTLLDGKDDPPTVTAHSKTFNHMGVARQFLRMNGVQKMTWIDANDAHRYTLRTYELIVSFRSWCFHTPPEQHLALVMEACAPRARLILDVRRDKPAWLDQLSSSFRRVDVIYAGAKTQTILFEAR
jgi:SAM-dependent methyltransferase